MHWVADSNWSTSSDQNVARIGMETACMNSVLGYDPDEALWPPVATNKNVADLMMAVAYLLDIAGAVDKLQLTFEVIGKVHMDVVNGVVCHVEGTTEGDGTAIVVSQRSCKGSDGSG